MAKGKQEIHLGYRIDKIQTTKFSFEDLAEEKLNELLNDSKGLGVNVNVSLSINGEKSTITINVLTQLTITETKTNLVEHSGRTVYFVVGLENAYNKEADAYDLPDAFLIQLYGIAYTHSRALLATEIGSTCYRDKYFLPVINPASLLEKNQ